MNFKKNILYFLVFLSIFLFLSYKLTKVPPGINFDESSIGYNAGLISKSLRDENNRFLPVFILTLDGHDWKQPVNIYTAALLFKILGRSYFNLRLVSVLWVLISSFIFFRLLRLFFSEIISLFGLMLYILSPSILIQSHLVLENAAPLPFFLLWLYLLISYSLHPKDWNLVLSGTSLGICFYSYKGMHAFVPVYFCLSILYLAYLTSFPKKISLKPFILFSLGSGPFLIPVPWLQAVYPGAVFERSIVAFRSLFDIANVYLSSFDFSFLFLKGDSMLLHSTGRHGMFLAPTIILLFLGLIQMAEEKNHRYFLILATLLVTPLPLTLVSSIYRASRLMVYIPLITFIFTLGVKRILGMRNTYLKRLIFISLAAFILANYYGFYSYYMTDYSKRIREDLSANFDQAMGDFRSLINETGKTPYVEEGMFLTYKADIQFFWEVYFPDKNLKLWDRLNEPFPENALSLTAIEAYGELVNYKEIPSLKAAQPMFYVLGIKE